MAAKRKLEFDDYSKVNNEVGSVDIHGVVTSLSPMKKSKKGNNYYHGKMSDGRQSLRFVGFASNHQKLLQDYMKKRQSIEIHNCQIKKSNRDSDKMELLVKGATKIVPSTKDFDIPSIEFRSMEEVNITLNEVDGMEEHKIITADVKVASCGAPITLGTRQKQEVTVCDTTGYALVQLWEENIGLLEEGLSYKLKRYRIVEFENVKSIAMCWEGSETIPIQPLENTVDPPANIRASDVEDNSETVQRPRIAAVFKLENFAKCLRCGSRTEPAEISEFVRCCNTDCGILSNSTFCETFMSAEILVVDPEGRRRIILSAFGDMIAALIGDTEVMATEEALLRCPPISEIQYQNNEIVRVVR